jgi:hypothetical protein
MSEAIRRGYFMLRAGAMAAILVPAVLLAAGGHAEETAHIPDFSGFWARMTFGAEPPRSGPGPIANLTKRPDGISDGSKLVGDYTNPLLKPWAAERVKTLGEISKTGEAFPDPSNQCAPQGPPFLITQQQIQLLQEKDQVTIIYMLDAHVRRIYLNTRHPENVTPSWTGHSVGHYEGDTLVVDTVGIKSGPVTMSDRMGSPQTEAMHVTERYRIVDHETAVKATELNEKEFAHIDGANGNGVWIDAEDKGRGLEVEYSIEDEGVFTKPWGAIQTYRKAGSPWQEQICAENTHEFYAGKDTAIPVAAKADF